MTRKRLTERRVTIRLKARDDGDPEFLLKCIKAALNSAEEEFRAKDVVVELDISSAVPNEPLETEINAVASEALDKAAREAVAAPVEPPPQTFADAVSRGERLRKCAGKLATEFGIKMVIEVVKSLVMGG